MDEEAPRLEIFGDSPAIKDRLGFDDYADILLELIGNFDVRDPLTIGIHGRWGSGKTSLMKMLEARFEDDTKVKTVWFNAWAYGGDEPIGLALLQHILMEFQKEWKCKRPVKNLLKGTGRLLADAALRKSTGISYKDAKDHFKRSIEIKSNLRHDFEVAIGECFQDGGMLVVFIDDLDRCLPEKTIEILEVIKLFLGVPKCIFVIGVEKEVIKKGIEVRYKSKEQELPISGQDYIEKIIQIPFVLPPIRKENMEAFIENLGIGVREKGYVTIVAKYTGRNPRKVKLFLNVLRIRRAIAERAKEKIKEIKPDLFAKLFVFEYVFPEFYEDIVNYKDQDFLCELERIAKGDSDEELEGRLDELLRKYPGKEDLSSLLRDVPFFCGTDIEPYIYLSGTEASHEVAASDESTQDELLSGDYMKMKRAADAINKMSDLEKQRFLDVLMSKLKDEAADVCRNAASALGAIGDAGAVPALIEALKDKDDANLRRNAASALGAIGDAGAVEALIEALKDKDDANVCGNAASALGRIGDAGAVDALIEALKEGGAHLRRYAAKALGRIGDPRAVSALEKALYYKNANVRRNAARALGRIGGAGADSALEKVLKERDDDVDLCKCATEALEEIKAKQNQ